MTTAPAVDRFREPAEQYRRRIRRLFTFGPSETPAVELARIGDEWTDIPGVAGIVGRDCPLPPDCPLTDDLSATLFYWTGAFPSHVHQEQETIHVLHGRCEVVIEGAPYVLGSGESITIGARVEHSGRALAPTLIVCAYHPPLPLADS